MAGLAAARARGRAGGWPRVMVTEPRRHRQGYKVAPVEHARQTFPVKHGSLAQGWRNPPIGIDVGHG